VSLQSNLLHVDVTCRHILIASIQSWVLRTSATVLTLQWLRNLRQSNRTKRIPLFCCINIHSRAEAAANLKSHSAFKINQYKLNSTTQELTLIQIVKNCCFYRTRWFSTASCYHVLPSSIHSLMILLRNIFMLSSHPTILQLQYFSFPLFKQHVLPV